MSKKKDQFSVASHLLAAKLTTLVKYSTTTEVAERLGIIPADNKELSDAVTPFVAAENLMSNKSVVTMAMTQTRDTAEEKAVEVARRFSPKWYYNNGAATATDILNAALEPHSEVRISHEGAAIEMNVMKIESMSGHRFCVTVRDSIGYIGKPVNIVFIRVRYFVVRVGTTIPAAAADFCKFIDSSKHTIILALSADDAGLQIAIASCYVDAQGVEGPYCAMVITNIS